MYDCIIIGSGPAGLSAAINLKTCNKNLVWFGTKTLSDKIQKAEKIVNYPGFSEITGTQLADRFAEHIESAGIEITEKTVTNVVGTGDYYMVLADNEIYEAKTLILAMGVMAARPLDGEDEFLGKGVSYCATCDGMLYKDKKIAVISNDSKFEHEVEYLADLASEVLYYPTFASDVKRDNVVISNDFPKEILGESNVNALVLRSQEKVDVDGVFCLRNAIAPARLIPGIELENGHVLVDRAMATNLAGCFACGDCTGRPYQYAKAVGEGNVAAHSVVAYLAKK